MKGRHADRDFGCLLELLRHLKANRLGHAIRRGDDGREAMTQAQKEGKGAVALDGRLIDIASIKQAEVMVKKAEQIAKAG